MARAGFIDITFLGDKELKRKFDQLAKNVQRKVVRKPLSQLADRVELDINAAIPVKTGNLKASGMTVVPLRSRGRVGFLVRTPTKEELGGTANSGEDENPKAYYPAFVELGHKLKGGGKVPAKPYIRGTMKTNRPKYLAFLRREIGRLLIKVAKRA